MKKEKKPQTANVNYIWVLAGGYLIYLGGSLLYDLWKDGPGSTSLLLLIPIAILFIAVGGLLLYREGKAYKYAVEHKDDPTTWSDDELLEEDAALTDAAGEDVPETAELPEDASDDGEEAL